MGVPRLLSVLLALSLLALASACARSPETASPSPEASAAARSEGLVLTVQVTPALESVDGPAAASVTLRNESGHRYSTMIGAAEGLLNVRVRNAAGRIVFDSASMSILQGGKLFDLAPGEASSNSMRLHLSAPGEYRVQAYTTNDLHLVTPPVRIQVSSR